MSTHHSRREFLKTALAAGTAVPAAASLLTPAARAEKTRSPNERLNLAIIGCANRGGANLAGVSSENIVLLCDIDQSHLAQAAAKFPRAKTTDDYRRVFDEKNLDGVVVSTPDHMHAIPVAAALRRKLAVYCEKPLTHSIDEARTISRLTRESGAVTQMGNQIHNHPSGNYRRCVEIVRSGILGPIQRVHVWQGGRFNWRNGVKHGVRVKEGQVPSGVNYDLWLGPAPARPFHLSHFHFNWRYWWDFGGGQLADFVCHYMDLPYWALDLKYPKEIVAHGEKAHEGENDCPELMRVDYHFEARESRPTSGATTSLPPVHVTWYHGGWKPKGADVYGKNSAVLFEGTEGRLLADYTTRKVFMEAGKDAGPVKPSIPDSPGHHREWIEAVKAGDNTTTCNFEYGALLTECGHLGNISYRAGKKKLVWDAEKVQATNCPEAEQYIRREYRKGWTL